MLGWMVATALAFAGPSEVLRSQGADEVAFTRVDGAAPLWLSERMSAERAHQLWQHLDASPEAAHLVPVILAADPDDAEHLAKLPVAEVRADLQALSSKDGAGVLSERREQFREKWDRIRASYPVDSDPPTDARRAFDAVASLRPDRASSDAPRFLVRDRARREQLKSGKGASRRQRAKQLAALDEAHRVVVVEGVPSHTVPVHLQLGGWNENPAWSDHARLLDLWGQTYGARLLFWSGTDAEFAVSRPPQTLAATRELAWQHYLYCPDRLEGGPEGAAEWMAGLSGGAFWWCWWD